MKIEIYLSDYNTDKYLRRDDMFESRDLEYWSPIDYRQLKFYKNPIVIYEK